MSRKDTFLLEMLGEYWENVSRAEESAWKIFASYTALFAGLSLAHPMIGDAGFLALILLFSSAAVAIALRSNLWFARNLGLISNIEQEFLEKQDYGTIVPCWFLRKQGFISCEIWWIHIVTYLAASLGVTVFMYQKLELAARQWIVFFLAFCLLVCFVYGFFLYIKYIEFKSQAPGKYARKARAQS